MYMRPLGLFNGVQLQQLAETVSERSPKAVEVKGENRPWQLQAEWLPGWGSLSAVAKALWALTLVASS